MSANLQKYLSGMHHTPKIKCHTKDLNLHIFFMDYHILTKLPIRCSIQNQNKSTLKISTPTKNNCHCIKKKLPLYLTDNNDNNLNYQCPMSVLLIQFTKYKPVVDKIFKEEDEKKILHCIYDLCLFPIYYL